MTDDIDWMRIARYFAGECTPAEAEEIRLWVEADPERRQLAEQMRAAWEAAATPSTDWDTPASWQRLSARLRSRERRSRIDIVRSAWPGSVPTWRSRGGRWAALAAMALLAIGGGLLWRRLGAAPDREVTSAAPLREVRTPLGQRARFQLTDGTHVLLGPGSVLRYDTASFGISTRELELDGRAYFVVTHDPRRPFLVRTARTVTEDLGTEFVISDYTGDPVSEVVVASGTVAVRSPTGDTTEVATVLTQGQMVRLEAAGRAKVRRQVDLTAQLAWTQGRLVFTNAPVPEVIAELNRWYAIDLRLDDPRLRKQRFTASYGSQADSTVVRVLATAIGARVERRGRSIMLVPLSPMPRED